MKEYIVFDVETTGLNASTDKIVEIGAIHFREDGTELNHFQSLVNPGCCIPERVTAIHGITNEMVAGSSPIEQVLPEFFGWLAKNLISCQCVLAHNAQFDIGFINWSIVRSNLLNKICLIENPIICTLIYSRLKNPRLRSHSLESLVNAYSLPYNDHHRSISDCVHTKNVWLHLDGPNADLDRLSKFRFGVS